MQRTVRRVLPAVLVSVVMSIVPTLVARRVFGPQRLPDDVPAGELPLFDSAEGRADVERAYRSVLDRRPVPYVERQVPTTFGVTHVIESGPTYAPPVVLLHAYFATAAAWYRTVGALSETHHPFAVDVIGDANLSRPTRPVTSLEDFETWFGELVGWLGPSLAAVQRDLVAAGFDYADELEAGLDIIMSALPESGDAIA